MDRRRRGSERLVVAAPDVAEHSSRAMKEGDGPRIRLAHGEVLYVASRAGLHACECRAFQETALRVGRWVQESWRAWMQHRGEVRGLDC